MGFKKCLNLRGIFFPYFHQGINFEYKYLARFEIVMLYLKIFIFIQIT